MLPQNKLILEKIFDDIPEDLIELGELDLEEHSSLVKNLTEKHLSKVIWQEKAKKALSNALEWIVSWLAMKQEWYENQPTSILFPWPSWTWKTLAAKKYQNTLNEYFWQDIKIIKINCADYAWETPHSLTRLIWASAWYIGVDKKPVFHPDNIHWKKVVILLDEIEKAWPPFWNLLLSILDDGIVEVNYVDKDNQNPTIPNMDKLEWWIWWNNWNDMPMKKSTPSQKNTSDKSYLETSFKDAIVIATSNAWNREIDNELNWHTMWFLQKDKPNKKKVVEWALYKIFSPEFLWRFDTIAQFEHLTPDDAKKILQQNINRLLNEVNKKHGIIIEFSQRAKEFMVNEITSSKHFNKFWWRYIVKYFKNNILDKVKRAVNWWYFKNSTNEILLITEHNWKLIFSKVPIISQVQKNVDSLLEQN